MKYIRQFLIILAISFAGEGLSNLIPLPIPASIYGIIILFIGLVTKVIPYDSVKDTAHFLVEIMPVMFIPAAVGLMDSWELIRSSLLQYLFLTVFTTAIVMIVAGKVTQYVMQRGGKRHE